MFWFEDKEGGLGKYQKKYIGVLPGPARVKKGERHTQRHGRQTEMTTIKE